MDVIQPDSLFEATEAFEVTEVPDGRVVYQASREKVHYLNPSAVVVLELSVSGKTPAEITAFLKEAYDLTDAPSDSVDSCIRSFVSEGLLRLATR